MLSLRSGRIFLGRFNWNSSIRHVNSPNKKPKFHKMQIVSLGQNMEIQQSMSTIHHRQQPKKGKKKNSRLISVLILYFNLTI